MLGSFDTAQRDYIFQLQRAPPSEVSSAFSCASRQHDSCPAYRQHGANFSLLPAARRARNQSRAHRAVLHSAARRKPACHLMYPVYQNMPGSWQRYAREVFSLCCTTRLAMRNRAQLPGLPVHTEYPRWLVCTGVAVIGLYLLCSEAGFVSSLAQICKLAAVLRSSGGGSVLCTTAARSA